MSKNKETYSKLANHMCWSFETASFFLSGHFSILEKDFRLNETSYYCSHSLDIGLKLHKDMMTQPEPIPHIYLRLLSAGENHIALCQKKLNYVLTDYKKEREKNSSISLKEEIAKFDMEYTDPYPLASEFEGMKGPFTALPLQIILWALEDSFIPSVVDLSPWEEAINSMLNIIAREKTSNVTITADRKYIIERATNFLLENIELKLTKNNYMQYLSSVLKYHGLDPIYSIYAGALKEVWYGGLFPKQYKGSGNIPVDTKEKQIKHLEDILTKYVSIFCRDASMVNTDS